MWFNALNTSWCGDANVTMYNGLYVGVLACLVFMSTILVVCTLPRESLEASEKIFSVLQVLPNFLSVMYIETMITRYEWAITII